MPIQNKSHRVNEPLFLGKSWDCVQMGIISPLFPRRAGADPSLVSLAGTSAEQAGSDQGSRHGSELARCACGRKVFSAPTLQLLNQLYMEPPACA